MARADRFERLRSRRIPLEKIAAAKLESFSRSKVDQDFSYLVDSMSPIDAADIARAKADGMFLGERLQPIITALDLSRKARALMRQNLWLAVIYNTIAVPLAIAGFVTPLIAAAAMSGSSVLVTVNALRARAPRRFEMSRPQSTPARSVLGTAAKASS